LLAERVVAGFSFTADVLDVGVDGAELSVRTALVCGVFPGLLTAFCSVGLLGSRSPEVFTSVAEAAVAVASVCCDALGLRGCLRLFRF